MLDEDIPAVLVQDNRVVACNAAACRVRHRVGSSLATAHSISHGLVHFSRDIDAEHERLRFLADAAYRFSGSISIHEPSAILLEVSGSLKLFGGLYGLKRSLISLLGELGHRADIGIAHTPLAALALARARRKLRASAFSYGTRRKNADAQNPAADPAVPYGMRSQHHRALLEHGASTTLGEVFRLPTAELGRRFGPKLLDYLERLSGTTTRSQDLHHACRELHERTCVSRKHFEQGSVGFSDAAPRAGPRQLADQPATRRDAHQVAFRAVQCHRDDDGSRIRTNPSKANSPCCRSVG